MQLSFPYARARMPVFADNVVASSQSLAVQAGVTALAQGGNAIDAALATAITLTVVEPTSNGIGSDAFALVWDGDALHGLDASGAAPLALTPERMRGHTAMPTEGWNAVSVPGAVQSWADLSARWGALPFGDLFESAIRYARDGFIVSRTVARQWALGAARLHAQPGFAETFLPNGRAPLAGERFKSPGHARTLALIAAKGSQAFYQGEIADAIAGFAKAGNAALQEVDLAAHKNEWVAPLHGGYRDHTVSEIPPAGQGIAALMALGMLEHTDLTRHAVDSAQSVHLQIEAMRLAFADAYAHVADRRSMRVSSADLLDPSYLKQRAALIDRTRAQFPSHGMPPKSGTIYLSAADAQGRMVSFIQSNFMGFGSGVVVPGYGVSLQNRAAGFKLDPAHPNALAPGKRPFHTIIPAFLSKDGQPLASYGVMGGHMQPQGHAQMAIRLIDYDQNPQSAIDGPRWRVDADGTVEVEAHMPHSTVTGLAERGHRVRIALPDSIEFGAAQMVHRLEGGGYIAGSESRRDGCAAGI